MAHRKHVSGRSDWAILAIAGAAFFAGACSEAGSSATEFRGRVIDQDTGLPIAGAIVVGKYMGARGFEGASSCNRVESAVSDKDGWFTLPLDPRDGEPLMEAYHRGYKWGRSPRWAQRAADGNVSHWQVQVVQWNAENSRAKLLYYESTIYRSEDEALRASRERTDVYLKPSTSNRDERLKEVHRLHVAASCVASHQTTAGPTPFFEALYEEELDLGDDSRSLEMTREYIQEATASFARARNKR